MHEREKLSKVHHKTSLVLLYYKIFHEKQVQGKYGQDVRITSRYIFLSVTSNLGNC